MTGSEYGERQRAFGGAFGSYDGYGPPDATIVVLPSLSFPVVELQKITAVTFYEHRLLCLLLLLAEPGRRMVFVSSMSVDPVVLDYYLSFLPDPEGARARLTMMSLGDPAPHGLSLKLLERRSVLDEIRALVSGARVGYLIPFNVTEAERRVADVVGLPIFGPAPEHARLGTKTGSRQVAKLADVPVLDGFEGLTSMPAVDDAIAKLCASARPPDAVVIKLNEGFSGQGSAIVDCRDFAPPASSSPTMFCGDGETWSSYGQKVHHEGAVVERLLREDLVASPSVQVRIMPDGTPGVISTHDQVLGGEENQVYLGCRFPASGEYRDLITDCAQRITDHLAEEGVVGMFGMDFLVQADEGRPHAVLSEINLRLGGTTHPFVMAQLMTWATYDPASGELTDPAGRPVHYLASDNIKSPDLVGSAPGVVIDRLDKAGLLYDPRTGVGTTVHLLGALTDDGKMGAMCLAHSLEEAEELSRAVMRTLNAV
ncbi:MAG: ATP-grasp domain-containing protein [Propionibacteriales bacterium]|nr:ATP-grasp domain-containing protein [Propionibacteriales bacterium]